MCFGSSKYKILSRDWTSLALGLILNGWELIIKERFTYLGSCFAEVGNTATEVWMLISKARMEYAGLNHLWSRHDVSLKLKGHFSGAAVRWFLSHDCRTWNLHVEDVFRLEICDH